MIMVFGLIMKLGETNNIYNKIKFMETKVLTQEEIQSLKEINEKRIQLIQNFGIIELRLQEFNSQKEILKQELKNLIEKETQLGDALQQKYGNGSINLEKGEFISN